VSVPRAIAVKGGSFAAQGPAARAKRQRVSEEGDQFEGIFQYEEIDIITTEQPEPTVPPSRQCSLCICLAAKINKLA
jgi:hypothetical protein